MTQIDFNNVLQKLHTNLSILREREAKYGANPPLDLLNQIEDHRQALALTEQAINGALTEAEWREALKPLLVTIEQRSHEAAAINISAIQNSVLTIEGSVMANVQAGGDVVGRDKISIGQQIVNFFSGSSEQQRNLRNRQIMLQRVHDFWIEGVLENSLHNKVLIELGLEERKEAVEYPWEMVIQRPDQPNKRLPPGTKIIDVFDEVEGSLLILGDPGAGKTTTLLQLARDTINRARQDPSHPIPIVFNLSSWTKQRHTIDQWLVDELKAKYTIPQKIAADWVEHDALLLLLDGLDEVALEYREACVQAINRFQENHLMPLVVCSRIADYEVLATRFKLHRATLLQSLTLEQISKYLDHLGTELQALRYLLTSDPAIQELARTPLMLNTMIMAYQGLHAAALKPNTPLETQRKHLFETYTQRMFARRRADPNYSPQPTLTRLAMLAETMGRLSQTQLNLEQMQPTWLSPPRQRHHYLGTLMLALGPVVLLMIALGVGIFLWPPAGFVFGLSSGLALALTLWLAIRQTFDLKGVLAVGGAFGLAFGLTYGVNYNNPTLGLIYGPVFGLITGAAYLGIGKVFVGRTQISWRRIDVVEKLGWSWPRGLLGLVGGGVVGFALGYTVGQVIWWPLAGALGLGFGGSVGLMGGLLSGLTGGKLEYHVRPNQGIRHSLTNALVIGGVTLLAISLPTGIISGIAWGILPGRDDSLTAGLIAGSAIGGLGGLMAGFTLCLFFGGLAVVQHGVLRWLLWRDGHLPWRLIPFLDYCVDRIFLRKVGGGYIFIHRYLTEYFASLSPEDIERLSTEIESNGRQPA